MNALQQLATNTNMLLCSQAPLGTDCCCCKRCGVAGCDLKVVPCGCCLHARCCPISENKLLTACPVCHAAATSLHLMPMSFIEIDQATSEATETNLSSKRGKKRQNATVLRLNPSITVKSSTLQQQDGAGATSSSERNNDASGGGADGGGGSGSTSAEASDLRTGRWTAEETRYCDALIAHFETGTLPIPDGLKLNDFLSNMLKSKQSRLTKKMKNARLSAKQYRRKSGYIVEEISAREFSQLEIAFFASIKCNMERSEIKFHMQNVWRELFSAYSISIGQKLDVDAWLQSVEEMDRRNAAARNAARRARRKVMMGVALTQDTMNPPTGVYIDPSHVVDHHQSQLLMDRHGDACLGDDNGGGGGGGTGGVGGLLGNKRKRTGTAAGSGYQSRSSSVLQSAPFLGKVIQYIQRRGIPFEHVDCWVPSVVPDNANSEESKNGQQQKDDEEKCRLCFGGCATAETKIPPNNLQPVAMSSQEQFDLLSFGEYSQKFSFAVGCGLPGRVYSSGVSSWERGLQSAPQSLFERGGGANQCGIQTAVGIPVASPNVGRVVVVLYSRHDRPKDSDLVTRIAEELTRLMPSPRWKLVVDVGVPPPSATNAAAAAAAPADKRIGQLLEVIRDHMPNDSNSPLAPYLPGFISLRLLLLKSDRTSNESDILQVVLGAFESYRLERRSDRDIACMAARDYMILSQNATTLVPQMSSTTTTNTALIAGGSVSAAQQQVTNATQQLQQMQQAQLQAAQLQHVQQQQLLLQAAQQAAQQHHGQTSATTEETATSKACDPKTGCCPPAPSQQQQQTNLRLPAGISPLTAAGLNLPGHCSNYSNQQPQLAATVGGSNSNQHQQPQQTVVTNNANAAATTTANSNNDPQTTTASVATQQRVDPSHFHGDLSQLAALLQNEEAPSLQH